MNDITFKILDSWSSDTITKYPSKIHFYIFKFNSRFNRSRYYLPHFLTLFEILKVKQKTTLQKSQGILIINISYNQYNQKLFTN